MRFSYLTKIFGGRRRKHYIFFRPSSHNWQSKIYVFHLFVHFYEIYKCWHLTVPKPTLAWKCWENENHNLTESQQSSDGQGELHWLPAATPRWTRSSSLFESFILDRKMLTYKKINRKVLIEEKPLKGFLETFKCGLRMTFSVGGISSDQLTRMYLSFFHSLWTKWRNFAIQLSIEKTPFVLNRGLIYIYMSPWGMFFKMSIDFGIVTVMPHFLPPVWQIFFIANMRREHNVSAFFKHRQKHQVQCFFYTS